MVYIEKDIDNPPAALIDPKWDDVKLLVLAEQNTHEAEISCYRDSTITELCTLYNNKCAFCERSRGTELQVDHYRPRKSRNVQSSPQYNQPGYYWLTYNWSNLVPLCSKCNNVKSNKFPLKGYSEINRIDSHLNTRKLNPFNPDQTSWLNQVEEPLLLNPEIEKNPQSHLIYKNDGTIKHRSIYGRETINICKLNRRDLIRERKEILHQYVTEIVDAMSDYNENKDENELKGALKTTFKRIVKRTNPKLPYSLFNLYIYNYFEYHIASKLPSQYIQLILSYFQQYKNTLR